MYSSNAQGPGAPVTLNVNWGGVSGALPICTLAASAATPATGSPLTLSANCSQSPNQYDWLVCSYLTQALCNIMPVCASSSTTCVVNNTNAGYAHYAIAATNSAGTGPRAGVDVEWKQGTGGGGGGGGGGGPPDPIPVCSALASDSAPLINTSIVLSASCSGNPTSYSWTGVSCTGVQCAAYSSSPGTVTYSVTAGNASGNSTSYVSVDWKAVASNPTPACSLSASNTAPVLGTAITITSSCTNNPDELFVGRLHIDRRKLQRYRHLSGGQQDVHARGKQRQRRRPAGERHRQLDGPGSPLLLCFRER